MSVEERTAIATEGFRPRPLGTGGGIIIAGELGIELNPALLNVELAPTEFGIALAPVVFEVSLSPTGLTVGLQGEALSVTLVPTDLTVELDCNG